MRLGGTRSEPCQDDYETEYTGERNVKADKSVSNMLGASVVLKLTDRNYAAIAVNLGCIWQGKTFFTLKTIKVSILFSSIKSGSMWYDDVVVPSTSNKSKGTAIGNTGNSSSSRLSFFHECLASLCPKTASYFLLRIKSQSW